MTPIIERAIRQAERLKIRRFELFFQKRAALRIDSKEQQVDSLTRSEDVGMSVRVLDDQRMGFSFTTSLDPAAVESAVRSALDVAKVMPRDESADLPLFQGGSYPSGPWDRAWDMSGLETPAARKVELARQLEAECLKQDPRIRGVRTASVAESASETWLVDSQGSLLYHRGTLYTARVACRAEEKGESQMGGDFGFHRSLNALDIATVARNAARKATELLGSGQAPTLSCPAILRNNVVADLIGFVSASFSAEEMAKGRSMLAGKQGQKVFSPAITLWDDGLLAGGIASSPFDGEGTPSQRTMLVGKGVFESGLYDGYYARKNSTRSTGNAARGIKSPPSISTQNLFIENGEMSPEALIQTVSRGILITELMGLHTANPVTGDFSLGASGVLIENGNLTKPVRGFAVAGNVMELFQGITEIGNDLRFFGSIGAPCVRVAEISVGGK